MGGQVAGAPPVAQRGGVGPGTFQQVGEDQAFALGMSRHATTLRPTADNGPWAFLQAQSNAAPGEAAPDGGAAPRAVTSTGR
ncbi:hypothetical protein GCM10027168_46650 [Streptomyces capparidis]